MKLSNLALSAAVCIVVSDAAPTPTTKSAATGKYYVQDYIIPDEAINGQYPITQDQEPLVAEVDGQKIVLLVNATLAEEVVSNSGIDGDTLDAILEKSAETATFSKRNANADADAKFHWLSYRIFEPTIKKRDADADAEADAKFHWLSYRIFEPTI